MRGRHLAAVAGGLAIFAIVVPFVSCGGESFTPTIEQPWHPATHQTDLTCDAGCEEIIEAEMGHIGPIVILADLDRDDPMAQFAECFVDIMFCWDEGGVLNACVAASSCPAPCRAEYDRLVAGAADEDTQAEVFGRVFVDEGAPCGPPEDQVSP